MQKKRENLKKLQSKRRNLQEVNMDGAEFTMGHMQEHRKVQKLRNPFVTKRRFMLILIRDFTFGRRFV